MIHIRQLVESGIADDVQRSKEHDNCEVSNVSIRLFDFESALTPEKLQAEHVKSEVCAWMQNWLIEPLAR